MGKVSFLPAQLDGALTTSARESRMGPMKMMMRDFMLVCQNMAYMVTFVMPMKTTDTMAELYPTVSNMRDCSIHTALFVIELMMMCTAIPAFLMLPGAMFATAAALCCGLVWCLCLPMRGPAVVHSKVDIPAAYRIENTDNERWMFINGCCTGTQWLQASCDRLALTFGRPITGIHNRTHGHIADALEGIVQRATCNMGSSGRVAYNHMKKFVLDPKVNKVVVIAHSQGGSIMSMVLDRLFAELPSDMMNKLEIYTFGSTATHFNNPAKQLGRPKEMSNNSAEPRRIIPYIEHYSNELDLQSRCGVLYNTTQSPKTKYCGRVFMLGGASGHLFNQHYMNVMFPLDLDSRSTFLDEQVSVEEGIAVRRETFGSEESIGRKSISPNGITNGLKISFISAAQAAAENCKGKTVRDLSRLWKYMDGQKPLADPDAQTNGVPASNGMVMQTARPMKIAGDRSSLQLVDGI